MERRRVTMKGNYWVTTFAVVGLFAVLGLVVVISTTDVIDPKQPSQEEKERASDASSATPDASQGGVVAEQAPQILLEVGDTGEAVRELQKRLTALGYELDVDGEYGMTTRWYVKDFQLQVGLSGDGQYDAETDVRLKQAQRGEWTIEPGQAIHLNVSDRTVTNPDDLLVLVNKTRSLPADYVPEQLVEPDVPKYFQGDDLPYNKMREVAADALERLFAQGEQEGLQLVARSGYRSYETQVAVFNRNKEKIGEEAANKYSARPGESEHQTGLVMDVTCPAVDHELVAAFEDTKEGRWLQNHAQDFGFIIRYPKGKEGITGYQYEPWHLRYVGEEAAQAIMSQNLTLEEYLLRN